MKRLMALALLCALICACCPAMAGTTWYCPKCGRLNNDNYCPSDGTARPADVGANYGGTTYLYSNNYTVYASVTGRLNQKLATRTGPSTKYDEPGTFLSAGSTVTVLSRAYDSSNGIWWVQVEFTADGSRYRAYTGAKRFDNLNLNSIPEEKVIGSCTTSSSFPGYYGPSYAYRKIGRNVPAGVSCTIYGYAYGDESDFIQIEFYDSSLGRMRRAWVPDWYVDNYTMYYGF